MQVRKLEFLLAEALQTGSNCLITCGGLQSNFCRAAAVAGRQIGLDSHLFLRCPGDKVVYYLFVTVSAVKTLHVYIFCFTKYPERCTIS